MITTKVHIQLQIDAPNLYRFGYSETDDVLSVVNWQIGNPIFYDVKDGLKYFFAENLYNKSIPIIRLSRTVMCAACKLEIGTIRLVLSEPLVDDWEDIQIGGDNGCMLQIGTITLISSDPLVDEWEDIQIDGDTSDTLIEDWEDIQINGCVLQIATITKI